MNAITAQLEQAKQILRSVWSTGSGVTALAAWKWFYSEQGAVPFIKFAFRMFYGPECLRPLAREAFSLEVEIAARQAGWCPEPDAPPLHADLITDC